MIDVSLNLESAEMHPRTIIIPYYPYLLMKLVERHPPAFVVIPVFNPKIFLFPNNLFVFVQNAALQTTFPSLKNLKVPL